MDKRNKALVILGALVLVFTIIGGTLAYFQWSSNTAQNTAVTFTVQSGFSCSADGGGSITSNDKVLAPAACTNTNYAIKRTITVSPTITKPNTTIYLDLWLKVNSLGTGLSNSVNMKYALTTSASNCTTGVVAEGDFYGATTDTKKGLLFNKEYSQTTTETYYLWIWLDAAETDSATQNQTFNIELGGNCTNESPPPFSGTIYRYSTEALSIGDSIALETEPVLCIVGEGYNSCEDDDFWYGLEDENYCNEDLQNYGEGYSCIQESRVTSGLRSYETDPTNLNTIYFLKHVVINNIVTESYVGLVITSVMAGANPGFTEGTYYLRPPGMNVYRNKQTLQYAFGNAYNTYCTENFLEFTAGISCSMSDLIAKEFLVSNFVTTGIDDDNRCVIENDNTYCYINGYHEYAFISSP